MPSNLVFGPLTLIMGDPDKNPFSNLDKQRTGFSCMFSARVEHHNVGDADSRVPGLSATLRTNSMLLKWQKGLEHSMDVKNLCDESSGEKTHLFCRKVCNLINYPQQQQQQ